MTEQISKAEPFAKSIQEHDSVLLLFDWDTTPHDFNAFLDQVEHILGPFSWTGGSTIQVQDTTISIFHRRWTGHFPDTLKEHFDALFEFNPSPSL